MTLSRLDAATSINLVLLAIMVIGFATMVFHACRRNQHPDDRLRGICTIMSVLSLVAVLGGFFGLMIIGISAGNDLTSILPYQIPAALACLVVGAVGIVYSIHIRPYSSFD